MLSNLIFFFFFFLLFHQFPDDEALMKFLHSVLSLTVSPTMVKSVPLLFKSSLTLSIHVFRCLPLLLSPSTCPCRAAIGNLLLSILSTWPNHLSLLFCIFSTTVSSAPNSFLVIVFLRDYISCYNNNFRLFTFNMTITQNTSYAILININLNY